MVSFCQLPWDDGCLRFYETQRVITTASYQQVRKPVYKTSLGRYQHYKPFLNPLKADLEHLPA